MKSLNVLIHRCIQEYIKRLEKCGDIITDRLFWWGNHVDESIRGMITTLNEKRGLFDGYTSILWRIKELVRNHILSRPPMLKGKFRYWRIEVGDSDFAGDDVFFSNIKLDITMVQVPKGMEKSCRMLVSGSTNTSGNLIDGKLDGLSIKLMCPFIEGGEYDRWLSGEVMHEFNHAYSIWKIAIKKQMENFSSMTPEEYSDGPYKRYLDFNNSEDNIKRLIGNIFYYLSNTEINAYISQSYAELHQIEPPMLDTLPTLEIFKRLPCWQEFIRLEQELDDLLYYVRAGEGFHILQSINAICYNKNFRTVGEAIRWLKNQRNMKERSAVEHLARVIKQ